MSAKVKRPAKTAKHPIRIVREVRKKLEWLSSELAVAAGILESAEAAAEMRGDSAQSVDAVRELAGHTADVLDRCRGLHQVVFVALFAAVAALHGEEK
jgi:hypothetical protein